MSRRITIVSKPPKLEKKESCCLCPCFQRKRHYAPLTSAQVSYYSNLIQNHVDWLYVGVYTDEAKTGTRDSRDGFQNLIANRRARKIDMVITKSISRFARNTFTLL